MRTDLVTGPDGMDWKVRLVWEPRWQALSRRYGGWRRNKRSDDLDFSGLDYVPTDYPDAGFDADGGGFFDDLGDDLVVALLVIVAVIVAGALFWWLLLPLLLVVVDLIVVLVLLLAGIGARVALGRPWIVEAVPRRGPRVERHVRGLRTARRERDTLAEQVRTGALTVRPAPADPSAR